MKRIIAFAAMLCMVLSFIPAGVAKAESDISGHFFENELRVLIHRDILTGYEDGTYRPDNPVTRAEFTAMLVRALDIEQIAGAEYSVAEFNETPSYTDVEPDDWFYADVLAATKQQLIGGYRDGSLRPDKEISRQEMAVMLKRALDSKGVVSEEAVLHFSDTEEIKSYALSAIRHLVFLGVIKGKVKSDGTVFFAPEDSTTRGETAGTFTRMLNIIHPPEGLDYKVVSLSNNQDPVKLGDYETFAQAKNNVNGSNVIMKGSTIIWINSGIAVSNKFAYLYTTPEMKSNSTYVTSGVEMKYIEATEDWVKVQLADQIGYVRADAVNLNPSFLITDRSYYEVKNGELVHNLYNPIRESWASYLYGKAPAFMSAGNKYYSWNGNTFYTASGKLAGENYMYFNRMPLYTDTQYTAEQLDSYIRSVRPNSPLIGTGSAFKKAEKEYGTNAMYFLSHAILESNWGESKIARDKNNLFGIGAVDSDPYRGAYTYPSYEEGILQAARDFIVPGYFDDTDWRFEGAHVGNKGTGMNVRYASDAYWGQKIASLMYRMDKYLSSQHGLTPEYGKYPLAESLVADINVRSTTNASGPANILYKVKEAGNTVQVLQEVPATGVWYKLAPKNLMGQTYSNAYVYSHGYAPYGTNFKKLPVAK